MNHNHELDWFYKSNAWRTCRDGFMKYRRGLCEKCLEEGVITPATRVHHKVHLTPENVNNPDIALNWDNLEALCEKHHAAEHTEIYGHRKKRWIIDGSGAVAARPESGDPPCRT